MVMFVYKRIRFNDSNITMNGITSLYSSRDQIKDFSDLNSGQTVGVNGQTPHDRPLHYQRLHDLLNLDKIPLELDPVTP